ncbi:MAG TPA: class I SAM-dependent methyltransferase [Gemmataceae bacterium]|jgi:SAM-dependent methyltransferase|nr:class I SAM-dependent methyltransferase [Gemmataceae bacterium]
MDGGRLFAEQAFHDKQAAERAKTFAQSPAMLSVDDDAYLDHESWIRPAFAKLGPLEGLRVLDFGCGHAMASVVMARQGAKVTGFDLSRGYLAEAGERAAHNRVELGLVQADGNRLPFATASFDRIWGNAILHHLDMPTAASEIARVLVPGGHAVFCEPWGENWLLRVARNRLWYSAKTRTVDEEPLREQDVDFFRSRFAKVEIQGFQLSSMVARIWGRRRWLTSLDRCDKFILDRIPGLRRYCRYVVLTLAQPRDFAFDVAGPIRTRQHGTTPPIRGACPSEA